LCAGAAIYYGLSAVLGLCGTRFHRGFWLWKVLFVCGVCVGFLFIPEESFNQNGFVWTARSFSVVFLFAQLVLLLSFSYDWNDKWVMNSEAEGNNERCWLGAILACAFLLYVGVIAGLVMLYKDYSSCTIGSTITTVTMLAVVGLTVLSLFRDRLGDDVEPGAILPAAVVSSYLVYQAWAALESNPDASCKPLAFGENDTNGAMGIGTVFTAISLMWLAHQTSRSAGAFWRGGKAGVLSDDAETKEGEGERETENKNRNLMVVAFHAVMVTSTLYISMVVTNWGAATSSTNDAEGQMWVRIASQWVTIALYLWTLVAPAVLPGREFGPERSQFSEADNSVVRQQERNPSTNVTYV
jgi:FtsH-binding integral membrane protein